MPRLEPPRIRKHVMESLDQNCRQLRPLADYADRLPSSRRGKKLNRATLWRWALRGFPDGRYLRTVALGSGRFTCDAWVAQFLSHPRPPSSPSLSGGRMEIVERRQIEARLHRSGGRSNV